LEGNLLKEVGDPSAPRRVKKPKRVYTKHGLTTLKGAVNGLGRRVIDKRTSVGKALHKWKQDLVADLGGNVSVQQMTLIELAVKSKLLLDSIDTWLLQQPTLINRRKKSLLPVVMQRQTLADGLARYLQTLGLEKKSRDLGNLESLLMNGKK